MDLDQLKADLEQARKAVGLAEEAMLDAICPYKVGDKASVRGYAHRDKPCRITSRQLDGSDKWRVCALLFKNDGSDSLVSVEWGEWNEPNPNGGQHLN